MALSRSCSGWNGSLLNSMIGPFGVVLDSSGNYFVAVEGASNIQKVSAVSPYCTVQRILRGEVFVKGI